MLPLRPCLPTFAPFPPSGPDWLHEIKLDGYRMFALLDGARPAHLAIWRTCAFPMIVAAVEALAVRSAFDLLGLDGHDLRDESIETRKAELARLLVDCRPALALNRVFDDPGPVVFEHACKFGCEGIVSKRRGSRYVGGRSNNWLTVKNPGALALAVRPWQEGRRTLGQMSTLILRRAGESRPDEYSVIHEGQRVGRIYRMQSTDTELWYWTEIGARAPNSGLADTLEAAETAFHSAWEMRG